MREPCIACIGNFDGVHVGHQAILAQARELGQHRGLETLALTFHPHPAGVLRPGSAPPVLMSLDQKIAALTAAGADRVEVLEPTQQVLAMPAEAFLDWLVQEHQACVVVEGRDFRFGKGRLGDVALLRAMGPRLGFDVQVVDPVEVVLDDLLLAAASSSLVRWLLSHGRVGEAARCLGCPYSLRGLVVAGRKRGRHLGVPTANLGLTTSRAPQRDGPGPTSARCMIPGDGVYGGAVTLADGRVYPAAVSVGTQPTFEGGTRTVEAHLIDFDGDLYDETIHVGFGCWVRAQQPFPGVGALREQLLRDIRRVRRWHTRGLLGAVAARPGAMRKQISL